MKDIKLFKKKFHKLYGPAPGYPVLPQKVSYDSNETIHFGARIIDLKKILKMSDIIGAYKLMVEDSPFGKINRYKMGSQTVEFGEN
jgi:hypothetical protein